MTGGARAAVLGSPVAHSLSPEMHRAAYAHLGLHHWTYGRHECRAEKLRPFVEALDGSWRGLSVTMPLKEPAFELAAVVDDVAAAVGVVNTLVRSPCGWSGHNTDVAGMQAALRAGGVVEAERALVLGSGATARAAVHALRGLGAEHVTLAVRGAARSATLEHATRLGLVVDTVPLDAVPEVVGRHDLVVDTLPGAAGDPVAASLAGTKALPPLFEIVYEGWPTRLVQAFAARGAPVASGLVMLAHQGAEQVALMTGVEDVEAPELAAVMLAAAERALRDRAPSGGHAVRPAAVPRHGLSDGR